MLRDLSAATRVLHLISSRWFSFIIEGCLFVVASIVVALVKDIHDLARRGAGAIVGVGVAVLWLSFSPSMSCIEIQDPSMLPVLLLLRLAQLLLRGHSLLCLVPLWTGNLSSERVLRVACHASSHVRWVSPRLKVKAVVRTPQAVFLLGTAWWPAAPGPFVLEVLRRIGLLALADFISAILLLLEGSCLTDAVMLHIRVRVPGYMRLANHPRVQLPGTLDLHRIPHLQAFQLALGGEEVLLLPGRPHALRRRRRIANIGSRLWPALLLRADAAVDPAPLFCSLVIDCNCAICHDRDLVSASHHFVQRLRRAIVAPNSRVESSACPPGELVVVVLVDFLPYDVNRAVGKPLFLDYRYFLAPAVLIREAVHGSHVHLLVAQVLTHIDGFDGRHVLGIQERR